MAYALAWGVYLLMAAVIVLAFERYVAAMVPRQPRIFIRALLVVGCLRRVGCRQKPCIWCQRALRCCSICSLSLA
jgi:hypothetical protein